MRTDGQRDAALSQLSLCSGDKALRVAWRLLGSRADAEDAVQEALARACGGWGELRERSALEGWFLRIVVHVCLRARRRRAIWSEHGPEPVDGAPGADEVLADLHARALVAEAVERLPRGQRHALRMRYHEDAGVPAIADALGVGAGTAKTHLRRGLARLRGLVLPLLGAALLAGSVWAMRRPKLVLTPTATEVTAAREARAAELIEGLLAITDLDAAPRVRWGEATAPLGAYLSDGGM